MAEKKKKWMQDLDFVQDNVLGARMSRGFWCGVAAVQSALDGALQNGL